MMMHTLCCDQCGRIIDQTNPTKGTLRNGYELRISKNIDDDPHFPIRLDLCAECSQALLKWLKITNHDLPELR